MLHPNNNELDYHQITEKIRHISVHRRRARPLGAKPETISLATSSRIPSTSPLRENIKRIPLLGQIIVKSYRLFRDLTTPGLAWKQRIRLIPILGPFAVWLNAILRLTTWRQQIALELEDLRRQQQTQHMCYSLLQERLDTDISNQLRQNAQRLQQAEDTLRLVKEQNNERDNRIASLIQKMRQQMQATARDTARAQPEHAIVPTNIDLDTFYVEFEEKFRGTQEDIRNRLKIYLPFVAPFADVHDASVVDIGCGRGEWLGLLKEAGIRAIGIDLNSAMVDTCRSSGFSVECTNAIDWLRQQPEGSLAAVTGFHIIEHLSFEDLITLFDAALKALRDDGLIIFETPNPENLAVGACSFYSDPTHQHPIVPAVAEFIARQRGFAKAKILRLHPHPESSRLPEDNEIARRINHILYGAQDYAVLAWKTYAD